MNISKILISTVKFLSLLTWKHIFQLTVLLTLSAISILFWYNKEYISGELRPQKLSSEIQPLQVSDKARGLLEDSLKKSSFLINTFVVVSVNLQQNTRRVIEFLTTDSDLEEQHRRFVLSHITPEIPLFSEDAENNKRLIRLINGELICLPFNESITSKYLKTTAVKYVCSLGVPPYYGKFRGIILVFVKTIPDPEEEVRIKILLRHLSAALDTPTDR